jgi:uncharacterized membrane protein YhaH (DUF805 family)
MDSPPPPTLGQRALLFLQRPLGRRLYALVGVNLMLLKYVVEWLVIHQTTGRDYAPLDFVNPVLSSRLALLRGGPEWLGIAWIMWTIPFLVIAMALSVRRALDAGWSPWTAMTMLVPALNLVMMVLLALLPSKAVVGGGEIVPSRGPSELELDDPQQRSALASGAIGTLAAVAYSFAMLCIFIYGFDSYGSTLFFGLPIVAGAVSGFWFNLRGPRRWSATLCVALLPAVIVGALLLVFAFEGIICLLMAAPLMLPLSLVGGVLGKSFAAVQRDRRP